MTTKPNPCSKCQCGRNCADVASIDALCKRMRTHLVLHSWQLPKHRTYTVRTWYHKSERTLRKSWNRVIQRRSGRVGQGIIPSEQELSRCARALVDGVEKDIRNHMMHDGGGLDVLC